MNRSLFLAALLFATGCSSAAVTSAETTQDLEAAPLVQTVSTSAGDVLANGGGLSLYTFDNDTTSESTCYDACAARWPALVVPAYTSVVAPFATTTRRDGQLQLTLGGHPLYTFAGDVAQGDVNGDGLGGVWHLARPSAPSAAPVKTVSTTAGDVLANEAGLSLYTFDKDTTTDSTCYDACAARWPALTVPADAVLGSPFGTSTRRDGQSQLTLGGHPLYTFAGDVAEGDVNGDGIGGVWHLARPTSN